MTHAGQEPRRGGHVIRGQGRAPGHHAGAATSGGLLQVEGLSIGPPPERGGRLVVESLDLAICPGEVLALVGESGSGKTMTALSLLRLLPDVFDICAGSIRFDGREICDMAETQLNEVRGGKIGMIFQQPQAMLDPTATVGSQVAESLRLHRRLNQRDARSRAVELLREVGIPEPEERARNYAHQMSGGMAQRIMIAAALSADPKLLIADEPTTALDVTVQAQILALLDRERRNRQLAILLITHDLTIVSSLADRVAVMYAGRIVEEGPAESILNEPRHPYTQALLRCSILEAIDDQLLYSIPSVTESGDDIVKGCRFRRRCTTADEHGIFEMCEQDEPRLSRYNEVCSARCWAVSCPENGTAGSGGPPPDRMDVPL
ncbi:MAG: ABC transporter ATP-binding protein [Rhodobacteraceae bacterium]|nr:ABC transporter ATP-binding protein [Paracoccaceae bacterium]